MEPLEPRPRPTPGSALALFIAVLVSNVGLGYVVTRAGIDENWLLVATPLMVLFWTAIAILAFRVDVREALLLRLPSGTDLLMAIPLAFSFVVLSDQLSSLTDSMIPEEIRNAWLRLVQIEGPLEWVFKISTIAVGAAVSEELMFRGFILNAFLGSMRPSAAVIWTSLLFMVLHVLPLPSFAAAGLVLGVTALATRSIVVPVLIHFVNNAATLALVNLADLETLGDPVWIPATILLPAIAIFALTMGFFARRLLADSPSQHSLPGESPEVRGAPSPAPDPGSFRRLPPLSESLASVPPEKRRLGFFVVAAAVVVGTLVLLALFVSSLYMTRPRDVNAALIDALSQECQRRLAPEAYERGREIEQAFAALDVVNDTGNVSLRQLFRIASVCAAAGADGSVDSTEVDSVLEAVREVQRSASPRRL